MFCDFHSKSCDHKLDSIFYVVSRILKQIFVSIVTTTSSVSVVRIVSIISSIASSGISLVLLKKKIHKKV